MKLHELVKVKSVKHVDPIWYGKEGEIVGIYGEHGPFFYEVAISGQLLLFRGDELEEVKESKR